MNKINWNGITIELIPEFTPEMAKDILAKHNNKNRRLSKKHVKLLETNMEKGSWLFNGMPICFDDEGELLDGQHRLTALAAYNKPLPILVVKGLSTDVIKTIDQAHKNRSLADILRINGVQNADHKQGIIRRYYALRAGANIVAGSSSRYLNFASGSKDIARVISDVTIEDQYLFYYQHREDVDDSFSFADKCKHKLSIMQVSEIGGYILYLSVEKQHTDEEVVGFFDRLFFTKPDIEVINLLRDALTNDAINGTLLPSTRDAYIRKAWNAYITGKKIKTLSYNKSKEGVIQLL